MAGITLTDAQTNLAAWMAADKALAAGAESYTVDIGGTRTTVTKTNAAMVRQQIDYWNRWCIRLSRAGGLPVKEVIPK